MAITYSGGLYTLSTSGSYTPEDLYDYDSAGITRHTGSRTIYDFGSSRIIIDSGVTLTIDTDDDFGEIMFSDPGWDGTTYKHHIWVKSGGVLNLGNTYSQDLLMISKEAYSASYLDQVREWRIEGELNWYGGIVAGGNLQTYSGASGFIGGYATFYTLPAVEGGSLRMSEADFVPTKLRFFGGAVVPFVATTDPIKGLTFINCSTQPAVGLDNNNTSGAEFMVCEDWDVSDTSNARGFGYWDQRWARYINQATGTDFNEPQGNLANNSNNRGLLEVRQSIEFTANNGGLAKFYTKDTDNGSRLAANQIVDNSDYEADRTYELTESSGTASYDTDGGVLIGVYWRTTGGLQAANNNFDSRGNADDTTDIFTWLKVEYGYQPATLNVVMKGNGGVSSSIPSLADAGITESTRATVAAYTGITPVYATGTLTVTVDENHTLNEVYDYIKYWESENPDKVWDNSKSSFMSTSNKLSYIYNNLVIVVDNATLTLSSGQSLPTTPTVQNDGALLSDAINLFFDGSDLVKASKVYFQIKDADTSSDIEGAVIGFGDATEQERLLYNNSFVSDTLVTDVNGKADGYFAFEIGSTSYTDMKQVTGDYSYNFSVVPRNLTGASIGSSTTPEVIRLAPDGEVTLSKTDAGNITGITVDVPTDTIDLSDETLSNAYDNLKYQVTADGEIYTGVPGCMYYCLYGLPLNKSVVSYTGRSSSTIYQNFNGTGAIFSAGVVELDTAGTYSSFTFGDVQINFEGAGTYDLRGSTFSSATLDTIGDYTVTAKLPTGVSYTNNDPTNITVEASTAITVSNVNIVDGSRVQLYNITQDTELENTIVSGGSGYVYSADFGSGEEIELNDQIRLRATYVNGTSAKGSFETTTVASGGNISFLDEQLDCDIYDALGVDGSTVTKFTADYSNEEVDVVVASDFNASELFAWWCYNLTLEDGIRYFFGGVTAQDVGNFRINTSILDAYLDNTTTTNIVQLDNRRIYRDDGNRPVKNPSTGGGGIDVVWRNTILLAETGVSGLTASESNQLSSITTVLSNQGIINTGVKKSSKGIPHSNDVA
jgi:hypothetical protein